MIPLVDGQPNWPAIGTALAEPFDARYISFKPSKVFADKNNELRGSCTAMAYLDARAVQERLDTVCGPANWVFHWEPIIIGALAGLPGDHLLVVRGTLTIYGVPKQDVGTASNSDPDKGAVSDTLKRCFVMWGGAHDLYDLPALYMNMERNGTSDRDKWRPVKGSDGTTEQERLRKKLQAHRNGAIQHEQRQEATQQPARPAPQVAPQPQPTPAAPSGGNLPCTTEQQARIDDLRNELHWSNTLVVSYLRGHYEGKSTRAELTREEAADMIDDLQARVAENAGVTA